MQGKHYKTLEAIFTNRISGNILWKDIEAMLRAFGAELSE